jgi:IS1 family transposase
MKRIKAIADKIHVPVMEPFHIYELDELCTFIGSKRNLTWIAYAINRTTKQTAAFSIGSRSNLMLSQVTEPLLEAAPLRIYTDKLLQYKSLIPATIHSTRKYGINHIERKNLTLRTHLKRLNRKTICFSRSMEMLHACLVIYFFS